MSSHGLSTFSYSERSQHVNEFFYATIRATPRTSNDWLSGWSHTHFMRGRESNGRHRSSEGRRGPLEHPHPKIYFVLILSSLAIFHLRTPSLQQVPSVVLPRTVSSSSQRCRVGLQRPTLRKLDTSATSGDFFARSRRDIRDLPILVTLSEGFVLQEQLFRAFVTLATLGRSGRFADFPDDLLDCVGVPCSQYRLTLCRDGVSSEDLI